MKLSIVIPVYNTENLLPACVDSVLNQTFRDYELILVDDGSTDNSLALCREYAEKHDHIRVIHQENAGASAARNAGIEAAKGEYIHFIDSDDLLPQNDVYERVLPALDGDRQILFSRRIRFQDGSDEIDAVQPEYDEKGEFRGDVLKLVLSKHYQMTLTCPVNKIIQRKLLIDNDLRFRTGLDHEEDEFLPRVIAHADNVWFDDGVLYKVRVRKGSLSEIDSEETRARKACSKVKIAATGMAYMEDLSLSPETLSFAAEYYWDYLIDACAACRLLTRGELKRRIRREIADHRGFFDSYRYLQSKNRRVVGVMFKTLGIRVTVKMIGIRYGK